MSNDIVERLDEEAAGYAEEGLSEISELLRSAKAEITKLRAERDATRAAVASLVNAKVLKGVRAIVAGWNGEGRDEPYKERHPKGLGATLPKTNCGAVYELDEAMQVGRALIATEGKTS